jgi:hypothetical protein
MAIFSKNIFKTRVDHICWGCKGRIRKGSSATFSKYVDGGGWWSAYFCKVCDSLLKTIPYYEAEEGFQSGQLKEFYNAEWEIINKEEN